MNPLQGLMDIGHFAGAHPYVLWGTGLGIPAVVSGLSFFTRGRRERNSTTHGSARWATYREVIRSGLSLEHGVVVGTLKGQTFYDDGPTHSLLCGPTRSHKGVCHIQPTLERWQHSVLATDPKNGENYQAMVRARGGQMQIEAFAPYGRPQCCIDVTDTIRWGDPREFDDALAIGQSLTAPRHMAKETEVSLHFREWAAMLLAAVQLHVGYARPGARSLPDVWTFLTQRPGKTPSRRLLETLELMTKTRHVPQGSHPQIVSIVNAIGAISGERELGSIWSTAIRPLILYNAPYVAASTRHSTLDLRELQHGGKPIALFLLAPSATAAKRLFPVYRVILDVALLRLMDRQGRAKPADYNHRLLLLAEELPVYGYCATIDGESATMAGYGIQGLYVVQDIEQFEYAYGEKNTIWGNTETKIFHAPNNERTAERISEKFLGEATVAHPVLARQDGLLGSGSVSHQSVGRALLTPDEVYSLPPGKVIVRRAGGKSMLLNKLGFDPKKHGGR